MTQKLQCKTMIFDFDGTLADSMPFLEDIGVQIMMKYYDVDKEDATQRYRSTTGLPYEHQIEMNFTNNERNKEATEDFEKLKIDRIFEQVLFPETEKVLKILSQKGIDIFVSSSTFQPTIMQYFEQRKLDHYFKEILGFRPGFEKGADHFKHLEKGHGINLDDVLFVGDSLKDYERSRGYCRFIGITGIFSEEDYIHKGHTGFVVGSIGDIPDLLE
ncbi:MAG: HAD family hydrolase [Candidatus Thorarchaeota archaeon]|nr:HAD family hydrolase [Candidatus Thorarchaeota archaeon]